MPFGLNDLPRLQSQRPAALQLGSFGHPVRSGRALRNAGDGNLITIAVPIS